MLPAVLIPAILPSGASEAQEDSMPSAVYPFEKLPVRTPNGAEIRAVLKGKLATGESLEVPRNDAAARGHAASGTPSRAFRNVLVREGTVELTINGNSHRFGPGSVGFVHSNDEHGIKNVVTTPATYFVVAWAPEQCKKREGCIVEKIGAPSSSRRPGASSFMFGGQKKIFAAN